MDATHNENLKKVFVPDLDMATWLQGQFPGSQVKMIDLGIESKPSNLGRPKLFEDNKSRQAAYRARLKSANNNESIQSPIVFTEPVMQGKEPGPRYEKTLKNPLGINVTSSIFLASIFVKPNQNYPDDIIDNMDIDGFDEYLESRSKLSFKNKEDNIMFSPALFQPGKRSEASIIKMNGIVLDFDGGDVYPLTLTEIFPELRMTTYATHSSTLSAFRYRAYIPTTQCMTAEAYKAIATQMRSILIEKGFTEEKREPGSDKKAHGLDPTKLSAASLFYLPCVPADPAGVHFATYKGGDRKPLDVNEWIDLVEAPFEISEITPDSQIPSTMNPHLVKKAIENYRTATATQGHGHHASFPLMLSLGWAGCSETEARAIASQEFMASKSSKDRLYEINGRIIELKGRGFFLK